MAEEDLVARLYNAIVSYESEVAEKLRENLSKEGAMSPKRSATG